MYSNKRNGFSILDIFVKIIFIALFIFILIWLFKKNVPNMTAFYSNVFRENIKYMQEAGESYFTDDKMPQNVGDTVKITLSEMFEKKLILPFVDEDGNSCNQYESYVSITKEVDESYSLKTNLVCNKEQDYTIKVLGCHNYCKDNDCSKTCSIEKITSYQYKKLATSTKTVYSCPSGYKLNGKYCYKTVLSDTTSAKVTTVSTTKIEVPANVHTVEGEKTLLNTIKTSVREYVDRIEKTTPGQTTTTLVPYTCTKEETTRQCTTSYTQSAYSCNCTTHVGPTGKPSTTCSTCYETVPVETCKDVTSTRQDTCYKSVTSTTPDVTTYSCPVDTIAEGSKENLKCYKVVKKYSCPAEANLKVGSGASLKCYKVKEGSVTYTCPDSTYTLNGNKCYKYINEESIQYTCKDGYKLEGTLCKKYTTEKVKANSKKVTTKYYKYQWSTKTSISGWTKTGKTKTIDGKEICK